MNRPSIKYQNVILLSVHYWKLTSKVKNSHFRGSWVYSRFIKKLLIWMKKHGLVKKKAN